jgi:hypothetical protein
VWGSGCIDPCFLDLGSRWRGAVSFTPQQLYPPGKSPRCPFNMSPRTGQDDMKERKFLSLPGLEFQPLCLSVGSQSVYRLWYPKPHHADTADYNYKLRFSSCLLWRMNNVCSKIHEIARKYERTHTHTHTHGHVKVLGLLSVRKEDDLTMKKECKPSSVRICFITHYRVRISIKFGIR